MPLISPLMPVPQLLKKLFKGKTGKSGVTHLIHAFGVPELIPILGNQRQSMKMLHVEPDK